MGGWLDWWVCGGLFGRVRLVWVVCLGSGLVVCLFGGWVDGWFVWGEG